MTKQELMISMRKNHGIPLTQCRKVLKAFETEMLRCVINGDELEYYGYFSIRYGKYVQKNPVDPFGNPFEAPKRGSVVNIKPGAYLKRANGQKARKGRYK